MRIVLFDLDHTLITGDSDYAWAQFLIEQGVLEREVYEAKNQQFYDDYKAGVLDIRAFLKFQLKPLSEHSRAQLDAWHDVFMKTKILPMIPQKARDEINRHRQAADYMVMITATNSFVTAPIARELGIEHLIATEPEVIDGVFTGGVKGLPCFREGKITRLNDWLAARGLKLSDFSDSWFYSDSLNDLPLLEQVTHPVAVHPDATLRGIAGARGWPILDFND